MPRPYRTLMYTLIAMAGLLLVLALGGFVGAVPKATGFTAGLGFVMVIGIAAAVGLLGHRAGRTRRSRSEGQELQLLLLTQLGPLADDQLQRMAASSGPAAAAAAQVLAGRRSRLPASPLAPQTSPIDS